MRLLASAIFLATIALAASASRRHAKRQTAQSPWETPKATENQIITKPIISEPFPQNSDISQIATDQILKQLQQSTSIYNIPNLQPQLLQATPSQTQLNYNINPFNPGSYYITNPPNPIQVQKAQELTSSAEVRPVQHSSVVNHGSYNPFESSLSGGNQAQLKRPPQSQPYAPIKLSLPAQPYAALPQAHFVPQKRPQYQVQPQQLVTPNVQYNFAPQKAPPNRYNFQAQPPKPVAQYNPLSAVLNPYQLPQKAALPTPSSTPVPFHARPQSFQTVVQKQKPNTTPSRVSHREDVVKNVREDENEDAREIDDREGDDENDSREEYNYRDDSDDDDSEDSSIDEVDSREYRPSFQAARYIFNRHGESQEEDDEDSSSSNIYPKPSKHYNYDDNPFGKHYGNEHKKYLARYKKSRYYKPKKNKEPTYEPESKASQNIPVAIRNQKLVEEKWYVTKEQQ